MSFCLTKTGDCFSLARGHQGSNREGSLSRELVMLVGLLLISIVLCAVIIAGCHDWLRFSSNPYLGYVGFLVVAILLVSVNLNTIMLLLLQVVSLPASPFDIVLCAVNGILVLYSALVFFFGPPS